MNEANRLDGLLVRLRQLSLIRVDAVLAGAPPPERAALAEALAGDLEDALGQAHALAAEMVAELGRGPGPLATALARSSARRGAAPEVRERWRARLDRHARTARDLGRLWSAAAAVLPVLEDADRF